MTDYRAAIIGCGRMSQGHARAYREVGIPIVAAADIAQEALDRARENYDVERTFTDNVEILDEVRPDLVSVVAAEALHCPIVVAAAERGVKGIVCEKPMAMNLKEVDEMLEACRASGSKLTVSHQRYYSPQYVRTRELIAQGAIGDVRFAEAFAMAESIHTDGTHTIHMLLSLLGEPRPSYLLVQVDGNSDYVYYGHRCDHAGIALLSFENQVYAHLTWGLHTYNPKERLHPLWDFSRYFYHAFVVHGETGRLELDGDIFSRGEIAEPPAILRIVRGGEVERIDFEWPPTKSAIALEIEDLARTIETDAPPPSAARMAAQ